MVVHHPSQWPMIDEYGIDIHPGMYTAAAISEVKVLKLIILYRRNVTKIIMNNTLQTLSISQILLSS